jgi:type I restriction enzyme S subunit
MLRESDILLAKDGAGIGKIGIVKDLLGQATVNSSLLVIRSSDIFIPEFLFYLLKGPQMQGIVRARIAGSATPHLFQRDIKQFTLLIPPLEEQRRIVAEVERRLESARAVESAVEAGLKRARRLRQAVLRSAFEGRLR